LCGSLLIIVTEITMNRPSKILASRRLLLRKNDGSCLQICIGLGHPYRLEPSPHADITTVCPVSFAMIEDAWHEVYGFDEMHALAVALHSISAHLETLSGLGSLEWENGTPFDLELTNPGRFFQAVAIQVKDMMKNWHETGPR
jgi:hypothetical protein